MSPGSLQPWPVIRRGDEHHPVRTLQHLLRAHGAAIAADGIFGAQTEGAVRDFQRTEALAVDGVVGSHTWAAVVILVRPGSHGDAVRGVQDEFQFRDLSGQPGSGLAVDGIFGPRTEAAVRAFQTAVAADVAGVAVDGIVGPVTWQALVSGMLSF